MVKAVDVVDKYTVRLELAIPDAKFYLNVVDSLAPVIVPREAVETPGGLAENPIGTGAFMLKEFTSGEGALLVRNPDYYLKDKDGARCRRWMLCGSSSPRIARPTRRCSAPGSSTSCECRRWASSTRS